MIFGLMQIGVTTVHLSSEAVFLFLLGDIPFSCSPRSDKHENSRGKHKRWRNRIYRTCRVIIAVCVVLLGIYVVLIEKKNDLRDYKYIPILILECIALWAFGFSWLVKGKTLGLLSFFQDKPDEAKVSS